MRYNFFYHKSCLFSHFFGRDFILLHITYLIDNAFPFSHIYALFYLFNFTRSFATWSLLYAIFWNVLLSYFFYTVYLFCKVIF